MKRTLMITLLGLLFIGFNTSCTEEELNEFWGIEDETYTDDGGSSSDDDGGGGGNENAGYDYSYSCPSGSSGTIPIPPGTTACQNAMEYYARTYACNDVDNFHDATCQACEACGDAQFCNAC